MENLAARDVVGPIAHRMGGPAWVILVAEYPGELGRIQ